MDAKVKMLLKGLSLTALFFLVTGIAGYFGVTFSWAGFLANLANWKMWLVLVIASIGMPLVYGFVAGLIDDKL
jgi:NADH:ubiquinone oxidoreductase subunit 4 (subunit M)